MGRNNLVFVGWAYQNHLSVRGEFRVIFFTHTRNNQDYYHYIIIYVNMLGTVVFNINHR